MPGIILAEPNKSRLTPVEVLTARVATVTFEPIPDVGSRSGITPDKGPIISFILCLALIFNLAVDILIAGIKFEVNGFGNIAEVPRFIPERPMISILPPRGNPAAIVVGIDCPPFTASSTASPRSGSNDGYALKYILPKLVCLKSDILKIFVLPLIR